MTVVRIVFVAVLASSGLARPQNGNLRQAESTVSTSFRINTDSIINGRATSDTREGGSELRTHTIHQPNGLASSCWREIVWEATNSGMVPVIKSYGNCAEASFKLPPPPSKGLRRLDHLPLTASLFDSSSMFHHRRKRSPTIRRVFHSPVVQMVPVRSFGSPISSPFTTTSQISGFAPSTFSSGFQIPGSLMHSQASSTASSTTHFMPSSNAHFVFPSPPAFATQPQFITVQQMPLEPVWSRPSIEFLQSQNQAELQAQTEAQAQAQSLFEQQLEAEMYAQAEAEAHAQAAASLSPANQVQVQVLQSPNQIPVRQSSKPKPMQKGFPTSISAQQVGFGTSTAGQASGSGPKIVSLTNNGFTSAIVNQKQKFGLPVPESTGMVTAPAKTVAQATAITNVAQRPPVLIATANAQAQAFAQASTGTSQNGLQSLKPASFQIRPEVSASASAQAHAVAQSEHNQNNLEPFNIDQPQMMPEVSSGAQAQALAQAISQINQDGPAHIDIPAEVLTGTVFAAQNQNRPSSFASGQVSGPGLNVGDIPNNGFANHVNTEPQHFSQPTISQANAQAVAFASAGQSTTIDAKPQISQLTEEKVPSLPQNMPQRSPPITSQQLQSSENFSQQLLPSQQSLQQPELTINSQTDLDNLHAQHQVKHQQLIEEQNKINQQIAENNKNHAAKMALIHQQNLVANQNSINAQNKLNADSSGLTQNTLITGVDLTNGPKDITTLNAFSAANNAGSSNNINLQNTVAQNNGNNQQNSLSSTNNINLQNAFDSTNIASQQNQVSDNNRITSNNNLGFQNAIDLNNAIDQQNKIVVNNQINQNNQVDLQNSINQNNLISSLNTINQDNRITSSNAINQNNEINQSNRINQSNQINQSNSINQSNAINSVNVINPPTNRIVHFAQNPGATHFATIESG